MKKIVFITGLFILLISCTKKQKYPEARFDGNNVGIALTELQEKRPVFFTYHEGGTSLNYFVVKVNGEVQSYFDACAKCYPKKLGYRFEGGRLVCKACDVHYSIEDLKDGIGSCYPIKLRGSIEDDEYIIKKEDMLAGGRFF